MNKESKINLNASDYAISHCNSDKTYNGLEVHKMLCDAYIAGNLDDKDEKIRKALINVFATHKDYEIFFGVSVENIIDWLEKQGQGEQRIAWSEDDEYLLDETTRHLEELIRIDKAKYCGVDVQYYQRDIDWLKSTKDRIQSKRSDKPQGKSALKAMEV